jgi:hypothetical protein
MKPDLTLAVAGLLIIIGLTGLRNEKLDYLGNPHHQRCVGLVGAGVVIALCEIASRLGLLPGWF